MTVGAAGETLRLVERQPTPARPDADRRGRRQAPQGHAEPDRRLSGRQRADRGRAGHRHRRRPGADAGQPVARPPGARPARARGDHPRRRAHLCRLCPHARRDRGGDRGAAAAHRATADHRVRRRRRPRRRQARRDGRGRAAPVRPGHRHRRQSAQRGSRRDPPRHPGAARRDAREVGGRREAIAAAVAEAGEGDIILLAGKGHEQGQIVGDRFFRSTTSPSRASARHDLLLDLRRARRSDRRHRFRRLHA